MIPLLCSSIQSEYSIVSFDDTHVGPFLRLIDIKTVAAGVLFTPYPPPTMSEHPVIARLFASNAQWAADVDQAEPEFFTELAQGQSPPVCFQRPPHSMLITYYFLQVLWIGCADSRVPESVITGSRPGTIFVLRNIAKCVSPVISNFRGSFVV